MNDKEIIVIRQASDTGQLFGSVSTRDIVQHVKNDGFSIERRQVMLDKPIKTLGIYPITIALHGEVDCTISINVARSEEEAVRQARGEDILAEEQDQDEVAVDIEEVFEDEETARQAAEQLSEDDTDSDEETSVPAAEPAADEADQAVGEPAAEETAEEGAKDDA